MEENTYNYEQKTLDEQSVRCLGQLTFNLMTNQLALEFPAHTEDQNNTL